MDHFTTTLPKEKAWANLRAAYPAIKAVTDSNEYKFNHGGKENDHILAQMRKAIPEGWRMDVPVVDSIRLTHPDPMMFLRGNAMSDFHDKVRQACPEGWVCRTSGYELTRDILDPERPFPTDADLKGPLPDGWTLVGGKIQRGYIPHNVKIFIQCRGEGYYWRFNLDAFFGAGGGWEVQHIPFTSKDWRSIETKMHPHLEYRPITVPKLRKPGTPVSNKEACIQFSQGQAYQFPNGVVAWMEFERGMVVKELWRKDLQTPKDPLLWPMVKTHPRTPQAYKPGTENEVLLQPIRFQRRNCWGKGDERELRIVPCKFNADPGERPVKVGKRWTKVYEPFHEWNPALPENGRWKVDTFLPSFPKSIEYEQVRHHFTYLPMAKPVYCFGMPGNAEVLKIPQPVLYYSVPNDWKHANMDGTHYALDNLKQAEDKHAAWFPPLPDVPMGGKQFMVAQEVPTYKPVPDSFVPFKGKDFAVLTDTFLKQCKWEPKDVPPDLHLPFQI